jgi:hypothetical protein
LTPGIATWLLVLGWVLMLAGLVRLAPRRSVASGTREAGRGPWRSGGAEPRPEAGFRGPRPGAFEGIPLRPVPRFDRMLLLVTWVLCAGLTGIALVDLRRDPVPGRLAAGVGLFLAGMAAWSWARASLGVHHAQVARPPDALVTRGPYRVLRHPLYLATTAGTLGPVVAAGSARAFGVWAAVAVVHERD